MAFKRILKNKKLRYKHLGIVSFLITIPFVYLEIFANIDIKQVHILSLCLYYLMLMSYFLHPKISIIDDILGHDYRDETVDYLKELRYNYRKSFPKADDKIMNGLDRALAMSGNYRTKLLERELMSKKPLIDKEIQEGNQHIVDDMLRTIFFMGDIVKELPSTARGYV